MSHKKESSSVFTATPFLGWKSPREQSALHSEENHYSCNLTVKIRVRGEQDPDLGLTNTQILAFYSDN